MSRAQDLPLAVLSRLILCLVLLGGLVACGGDAAPPTADETPDNVVLLPVELDPTISFAIWFDVGSQNDPAGKEGLAALTGQMLSDGATETHSVDQILEKLYPLAASYQVRVDKEMTVLTGRAHRDTLDDFFSLFTDAYLRPAFRAEDFERLRSNQLSYLEKSLRYASDEEFGKAALELASFAGTAYAHPIEGTVAGIESLTVDDVKAFYQRWYTSDNATVALGGGYPKELVARFAATLDQLPPGGAPSDPTILPPALDGRQVVLVDKPGPNTSISFGFPLDVQRGTKDFYALWLANSWLGEHRNSSSHLFKVIREVRGLNYGDYSYIEAFPEGGMRQMPPANVARQNQLFSVWIRTLPNEQALFATRAALREIDALIADGMSEEEFELTRSFLSKYVKHFAPTTQMQLGYRIDDVFYGIDGDGHLQRFSAMMASLTRDEVNDAIRRHLQTENLVFALVTGDAEGLRQAMIDDAPSPIEYPTPKSDEVLAEDEEIASYPLNLAADGVTILPVGEIFAQRAPASTPAADAEVEAADEPIDTNETEG
ncbi:MAG: pitrilysin family protein [Acidobacteriota bacterium]